MFGFVQAFLVLSDGLRVRNVMFRNDGRWRAIEAGAPSLMSAGASANHPGRLGHSTASSPCLHHPRSLFYLTERAEAVRYVHPRAVFVKRLAHAPDTHVSSFPMQSGLVPYAHTSHAHALLPFFA